MPNLEQLLPLVMDAARKAGAFMQQHVHEINQTDIEYKGTHNLVSFVDKQCEEIIVNALSAAMPEAGFITEEETRIDTGEEWRWVIDPLDGTTNYLHRLPVYCVSIGLLQNNTPMLGVVYDASRDEMFTAIKGNGAHLNSKKIQVSPVTNLSESLIATGFPYTDFEYMDIYINLFKHLLVNCQGLRRMGSAAIDLCYVACGRFDGYYEYNLKPWDVAAGGLIVREAGGTVTDFAGTNDFIFNKSLVSGNKHTYAPLFEAVVKFWGR